MTTYDTNKAAFLSLVQSLAVHFPDYELNTPDGHRDVYFEHKTEKTKGFYLNPDNDKGKFTVSPRIIKQPHFSIGTIWDENNKQIESPSAGFSVSRPVEQIAKGIKTRFFPDFEIYYSNWIRIWNKNNDYQNGINSTVKEIASVADIDPSILESCNGDLRCEFSPHYSTNLSVTHLISKIFVSSANSVVITTGYLSKGNAKKLIEFVKTLSK
jgi:hypothetical protein